MTPTQLIAAVHAWSSHVITQPNDRMRLYVDAVLAMAELDAEWYAYECEQVPVRVDSFKKALAAKNTALHAAGVEVENG